MSFFFFFCPILSKLRTESTKHSIWEHFGSTQQKKKKRQIRKKKGGEMGVLSGKEKNLKKKINWGKWEDEYYVNKKETISKLRRVCLHRPTLDVN